jgi:hypothetical protein
LKSAVFLLFQLSNERLDIVPVFMFFLFVARFFMKNTLLTFPLYTLYGLIGLNNVVGDGALNVVLKEGLIV